MLESHYSTIHSN